MSKRIVLAGLAALCLAAPSFGQGEEEMMKKWMELATPGEGHKYYEQFVGEWETTTKMWMGGQPSESQGTAKFYWILGKRWLCQEYKGAFMDQTYEGHGLSGFDNYKKMHVALWVDTLSTALLTMQGTLDQTGKVLSAFGSMDEPMTGERGKTAKWVTRVVDADTFVFEIHDLHIVPGETKILEITYKRKK